MNEAADRSYVLPACGLILYHDNHRASPGMKSLIKSLFNRLLKTTSKRYYELAYWKAKKQSENVLTNDHYSWFYTEHFALSRDFYSGKSILDIGCGPRGSLEWATTAAERVGLDPLANSYLKLGADKHKMTYVNSGSEHIPFGDNHFDVVCSFNSLDHVDDLDKTIGEIIRVLKPKGLFLLLTDVNHEPTVCEPVSYSFDILQRFTPRLKVLDERHFEKKAGGMYESIRENFPFDHSNTAKRYGILSAKLTKE